MPNITLTGALNFPIMDWQMETADGGTHESVLANALLQFSQDQCLRHLKWSQQREKIISIPF